MTALCGREVRELLAEASRRAAAWRDAEDDARAREAKEKPVSGRHALPKPPRPASDATQQKRDWRTRPDVQAREKALDDARRTKARAERDANGEGAMRQLVRIGEHLAVLVARRFERLATMERDRERQRLTRAATPIEALRSRNALDARNKRARDAGVRAGLAFRLNEMARVA